MQIKKILANCTIQQIIFSEMYFTFLTLFFYTRVNQQVWLFEWIEGFSS